MRVLKTFFRVFGMEYPFDKDDQPKTNPKYKPIYTEQEIETMIDYVWVNRTYDFHRYRDRAILVLASDLGFRIGEVHQLSITDIHFRSRKNPVPYVTVQTLKHGRKVNREISDRAELYIRQYLNRFRRRKRIHDGRYWRGGTEDDRYPLWTTGASGTRLKYRSISKMLERTRKACRIKKSRAGFHAIRRRRVTSYHDGGATEKQITEEMGWTSDQTVKGYILPDEDSVKDAIRRANIRCGARYSGVEEDISESPGDEVSVTGRPEDVPQIPGDSTEGIRPATRLVESPVEPLVSAPNAQQPAQPTGRRPRSVEDSDRDSGQEEASPLSPAPTVTVPQTSPPRLRMPRRHPRRLAPPRPQRILRDSEPPEEAEQALDEPSDIPHEDQPEAEQPKPSSFEILMNLKCIQDEDAEA